MIRHYYIYYAIDPAGYEEAEASVRAVIQIVACKTGVHGRLLKKMDENTLWMEVYENVEKGDAFEHALAHALAKTDMEMYLATGSRRHVEIFTAFAEAPHSSRGSLWS